MIIFTLFPVTPYLGGPLYDEENNVVVAIAADFHEGVGIYSRIES